MNALCCILNYNCNDNSNYLYNEFNKYCKACVIDSNSDNPYPYFENVGNFYYTNLFNKSIEKFKKGNYTNLIIITSDIIISSEAIIYVCNIANSNMGDIGVYTLQTDESSKDCYNKYMSNLPNQYETNYIEGFFQIINKDVVIKHSYIPLDVNKIGVCIDRYTCEITKAINKKIIVDTNYLIHHPNKKDYDNYEAHSYDRKFGKWADEQIRQLISK